MVNMWNKNISTLTFLVIDKSTLYPLLGLLHDSLGLVVFADFPGLLAFSRDCYTRKLFSTPAEWIPNARFFLLS